MPRGSTSVEHGHHRQPQLQQLQQQQGVQLVRVAVRRVVRSECRMTSGRLGTGDSTGEPCRYA